MYGGRIPKLNWAFLISVTLGKKGHVQLEESAYYWDEAASTLWRGYRCTRPLKWGITGAVSPVNFQIIAWVRDLFKSLHKGEKKERTRSLENKREIQIYFGTGHIRVMSYECRVQPTVLNDILVIKFLTNNLSMFAS